MGTADHQSRLSDWAEDQPGPRIVTALRRRKNGLVTIVVDGRMFARVRPRDIDALRIETGAPLPDPDSVRLREAVASARRASERLLAAKPLPRAMLAQKLRVRDHAPAAIDAALDELEREGLLRERDAAESFVRGARRRGPVSRRLLESKMRSAGVHEDHAHAALAADSEQTTDADEAARLVAKRLRAMPPALDEDAKARRLLGALARRGFDRETSEAAVRAALPGLGDGAD